MEYDPSDSSGTDDDLPPSYQNRNGNTRSGGPRVSGNGHGRSAAPGPGGSAYSRSAGPPGAPGPAHNSSSDMESQIHLLEQEAYCSVLRAFKAQADAITWEKEGLITELRKELRVSDKEHRELLSRVNADDIIRRIREWRQNGGRGAQALVQPGLDPVPSPTVSASRKRQKTGGSALPTTGVAAQSPATFNPVTQQPSSSSALPKKAGVPPPFSKGKKPKPGQKMGAKSVQNYSGAGPSGRSGGGNRNSHAEILTDGAPPGGGTGAAPNLYDPLIGRKIRMRWPQDNEFYEAVITNFNPTEGLHEVVYDINTPSETWEWLNLKEILPEDIRWEGEEAGITASQQRRAGGAKKSMGRGGGGAGPAMPGGGRGRGGPMKGLSKKEMVAPAGVSQNGGLGRRNPDDIQILHTETLIKEVERVFSASHPDPVEIDKAKKLLKDHEQALIDAIAKLAEASDGESGGEPMATDALGGVGPSDVLI